MVGLARTLQVRLCMYRAASSRCQTLPAAELAMGLAASDVQFLWALRGERWQQWHTRAVVRPPEGAVSLLNWGDS